MGKKNNEVVRGDVAIDKLWCRTKPAGRPSFSLTISVDKNQLVFLDIPEENSTILDLNCDPVRRHHLSISEWRINGKEGHDHAAIHIQSKDTIRSLRDALNEALIYLDSCGE